MLLCCCLAFKKHLFPSLVSFHLKGIPADWDLRYEGTQPPPLLLHWGVHVIHVKKTNCRPKKNVQSTTTQLLTSHYMLQHALKHTK